MGLKEGQVLLSGTCDRAWGFAVCLWKVCSPTSSLGVALGRSPVAKTNESCGLWAEGEKIGAVKAGGDFSEAWKWS